MSWSVSIPKCDRPYFRSEAGREVSNHPFTDGAQQKSALSALDWISDFAESSTWNVLSGTISGHADSLNTQITIALHRGDAAIVENVSRQEGGEAYGTQEAPRIAPEVDNPTSTQQLPPDTQEPPLGASQVSLPVSSEPPAGPTPITQV